VEQVGSHTSQFQSEWGGHHSLPEGSGPEAKLHACLDKHGHQSGEESGWVKGPTVCRLIHYVVAI